MSYMGEVQIDGHTTTCDLQYDYDWKSALTPNMDVSAEQMYHRINVGDAIHKVESGESIEPMTA